MELDTQTNHCWDESDEDSDSLEMVGARFNFNETDDCEVVGHSFIPHLVVPETLPPESQSIPETLLQESQSILATRQFVILCS